jgi:hypothetical protein
MSHAVNTDAQTYYWADQYPVSKATRFRWDVIPDPLPPIEEHILSQRWIDLMWWDEERQLWVYIATRPNPNHSSDS